MSVPKMRRAGVTILAVISGALVLSIAPTKAQASPTIVRLDPIASSVWSQADGQSMESLATLIAQNTPADLAAVQSALMDLAQVGLIEENSPQASQEEGREAKKKLASLEEGKENRNKMGLEEGKEHYRKIAANEEGKESGIKLGSEEGKESRAKLASEEGRESKFKLSSEEGRESRAKLASNEEGKEARRKVDEGREAQRKLA